MKQKLVDKPAFEAVGWSLRTTIVDGESMRVVPAFWDKCQSEGKVDALGARAGSFGILGLCCDFDERAEAFSYVIAVEAGAGQKPFPAGTQKVVIPAATYAVFECIGAMPHAIQDGWKEIMAAWIPQSEYVQANPVNFERYPSFPQGDERGDPASPRCVTEIWIPVRKK